MRAMADIAGEGASDSSSGSIFIASRAAPCDDSPHSRHPVFGVRTTSIARYLRVQTEFKELQSKTHHDAARTLHIITLPHHSRACGSRRCS